MLLLEIEDDGRGLAADARHGVGLSSMRERAAELGGTFEIQSSPGNGTSLKVSIPLESKVT
jgi:signal transduction histidine kinase